MSQNNPNILLVKSVMGLYLNRYMSNSNGKLIALVDELCKGTRINVGLDGENSAAEISSALVATIEYLLSIGPEIVIGPEDIAARVKMNCGFDNEYVALLKEYLPEEVTPDTASPKIRMIVTEIDYALNYTRAAKMFADINRKMNFNREDLNLRDLFTDVTEKLEELTHSSAKDQEKAGFGGRVNLADPSSLETVFQSATELLSEEGLLKTGLEGINEMLGVGGYIRGECFCWGGLTHNYKTGILMDHCWWLPMFNTPYMICEDKKPLILRISFENKLEQDLPEMYRVLWESEHQRQLNIADINPKEAAQYIIGKLSVNGYHFMMECYDPNALTVWDLIDIVMKYIDEGYEVHAVIVDYMELLTRNGKGNVRQDQAINNAFETFRNFCFARGITNIHGHQLSTEAQKLAREQAVGFTKKVAKGSYWMNSQSLSTKFDGEAIMHIINNFLSISRGKHRNRKTPVAKQNLYYEFQEFGGLGSDLGKSRAIYRWSDCDPSAGNDNQSSQSGNDDW